MTPILSRLAIALLAAGLLSLPTPASAERPIDLSVAVVESTMERYPPSELGSWNYQVGFYLWGQYQVYKRTRDPRHLTYIKAYVDRFVDSRGNLSAKLDKLDNAQPGTLLLALWQETRDVKYRIAAKKIYDRMKYTYPRAGDDAWYHFGWRPGEVWADGSYMVNPFVIRYGQLFGDATWGNGMSSKQLVLYAKRLQRSTPIADGLVHHGYDAPGSTLQSWAHRSHGYTNGISWLRANGWYGMALVEVLDTLPRDHWRRPALLSHLRRLVAAYARLQDPATGLWHQVPTNGRTQNWTETSGSAMATYVVSRAVERGYVDARYLPMAHRGYGGVLSRISIDLDGSTSITEVCVGTPVGDSLAFYYHRARAVNDWHGLGAFLLMEEQARR